jgi:hypothetical protein
MLILSKPQVWRFTLQSDFVDFRNLVWEAEILIGGNETGHETKCLRK